MHEYQDSFEWGRLTDLVARSVAEFALPGEDTIAIFFGEPDRDSRGVTITAEEIAEVCTQVLDSQADLAELDVLGFHHKDDQHDGPWHHDSVAAAREIAALAVAVVRTACGITDPTDTEIAGGGPSATVGEEFFDAIDFGWADAAVWTTDEPTKQLTANQYYQLRSLQDDPEEDDEWADADTLVGRQWPTHRGRTFQKIENAL